MGEREIKMKKINKEIGWLLLVTIISAIIFVALYLRTGIRVENIQETGSTLENWSIESSMANNLPLKEDKGIYTVEPDNTIHDVYISVLPTKDENGEMLEFSDFSKHVARDHTYNPTLKCNIQILPEGEKPDIAANLDISNATIRVRGNSARGELYKSYKIKLSDEEGVFNGQTSLNINKHSEDTSKVTTKYCTDILKNMDHIVSYRTKFMRVWIRDMSLPETQQKFEYYGLFTHTEQPNKKFLEARGLSSDCTMYKARDFSFRVTDVLKNTDDPEYSEEAFEMVLGIREGKEHTKLLNMLADLNDETKSFEEVFPKYFNEENYLTWLSFNLLVGGEDILNHNFIIYNPDNSLTWYFFPWDFDSNLDLTDSEFALPPSLRGGQKLNQVVLHRRFFRIPGNLEKLQKKMKEVKDTYFNEKTVKYYVDSYKPVLEKTMTLMPDISLLPMQPDELFPYIDSFHDYSERKYQEFLDAFEYPSPMFVSMPVRNSDGTLKLSWDNSYSYQGRTITYNVKIASDCYMEDILFEQKNIVTNSIDADIDLPAGTYYIMVTAVDSEGNEQLSLEHYEFAGTRFIYEHGVMEFILE